MRTLTRLAAAAATALTLAAPQFAHADLPTATLQFITPTGTVAGDQSIEVWVRFTLDAGSVPLAFSSDPLTGFDNADLPTQGRLSDGSDNTPIDFASYTGAYLNTYFSCSGTFTNGCSSGPSYAFNFWTVSAPGKPSLNFVDAFNLAPGASTEYLFGTFDPVPGGAAAGTYTFFDTGLFLVVRGLADDGRLLEADITTLGSTCGSQEASCAFTREVTAVPEPATWGLMALGLAGLAARRRLR